MTTESHQSIGVPKGYKAVDLEPGGSLSPVKLCVLTRVEPDPVGGVLVVLREAVDSTVVLGCITDTRDIVQEWVEISFQNVAKAGESLSAYRAALSNGVLESRWRDSYRAIEAVAPGELVRTGFEEENPPPLFLDPERGSVRPLVHEATNKSFELCVDDAVLRDAGLPAYSTTLHRYLWVPSMREESPFVAVTPDGAVSDRVMPLAEALVGVNRSLVALNPGGGMMLVRRHGVLPMAALIDVLSGAGWSEVASRADRSPASASIVPEGSADAVDPDRLFLGRHGRWGRLTETLHLKLRLMLDAIDGVRRVTEVTGRPMLSLSDEAFRVDVWDQACGLPRLWTSRARLVDTGAAVALPVEHSRLKYFVSQEGLGRGIYRPRVGVDAQRGRCDIRIREVVIDEDGTTTVEGTFQTDDRVQADGSDLYLIRFGLAGERVGMYARLESASAMAAASGELRFRSIPQRVTEAHATALQGAEGIPMPGLDFETVPLLSTPCDLHALGVLAVRSLLVDRQNKLPVALDELLSLARQADALRAELGGDEAPALADRIRLVFESDPRWAESLGPHRSTFEEIESAEGFDLVPAELWWRVLAAIVRLFPGVGADSICRDLGDSRGGAVHTVFDPAVTEFEELLVRTRSLIVIDWRHNREVHAVVRGFREGMAEVDLGTGV